VLLLAAFHVGVAATVPIADAMLELASTGEPTHIESAREVSCGDGHEHVFCQLCRTVGLGAVPRESARLDHAVGLATYCAAWSEDRVGERLPLSGPIGPRAPPLA
jgi:hypothetical protein